MKRSAIIRLPLYTAAVLIALNIAVLSFMKGYLTSSASYVLSSQLQDILFWAIVLFLPNALLSWILYAYTSTEGNEKKAYILCLFSLTGGILTQGSIYYYFLSGILLHGTKISFVISGFPFTYLVGMMIGFVVGLLVALRED